MFLRSLLGGALILLAAFLVGIVHNGLRKGGVPLLVKTEAPALLQPVDESSEGGGQEAAQAGTLSLAKTRDLLERGAALFVDARSPAAYERGHIPGAVNVPYDRLPEYYDRLSSGVPTDTLIVVYCWSPSCDFSDNLARELRLMGFSNVMVYKGGWEKWTEAGLPGETSPPGP